LLISLPADLHFQLSVGQINLYVERGVFADQGNFRGCESTER
jgi:hypothetical protein